MKSAMVVVILMAAIIFTQHLAWSDQLSPPTVRLMVTKKGLDHLNALGPDLVAEFIQTMIGVQNIKCKSPIGPIDLLNFIKRVSIKIFIIGLIKLVCPLIKTEGVKIINQHVPRPPVLKISEYAAINYALVSPLNFTDNYIVSEHKGFLTTVTIPNLKPGLQNTPLPPFEADSCVDKMACVWMTEYVVNTASYVYRRAGKLIFNITEETIKDNDDNLSTKIKQYFFKLDTSTFSLIVPQLYYRYGGYNLMLGVRAVKEAPRVTFSKEHAMFNISAAIDVYVNNSDQQILPAAFTMSMLAFINASIEVRNGTSNSTCTLTADVSGVNISVSHDSSNIGEVDYVKINNLIKAFKLIKDHLLPSLNKKVKKGYQFNLMNNLRLVDPNITHFEGGLLLETDFEIT